MTGAGGVRLATALHVLERLLTLITHTLFLHRLVTVLLVNPLCPACTFSAAALPADPSLSRLALADHPEPRDDRGAIGPALPGKAVPVLEGSTGIGRNAWGGSGANGVSEGPGRGSQRSDGGTASTSGQGEDEGRGGIRKAFLATLNSPEPAVAVASVRALAALLQSKHVDAELLLAAGENRCGLSVALARDYKP